MLRSFGKRVGQRAVRRLLPQRRPKRPTFPACALDRPQPAPIATLRLLATLPEPNLATTH